MNLSNAKGSIKLYPNGTLNTEGVISLGSNFPVIYSYRPEGVSQAKDKVFLIIPGGGYRIVAINHEGHDVAKRLTNLGYASFVLQYRLPIDSQIVDKRIAPIQDAQSALVYIRGNLNRLGIAGKSVGVIGFSAGGHLASTLSTHFNFSYIGDVDKGLLRPDFAVLVYPVITMLDGVTHQGSKMNLIGPNCKDEDVERFSNERNVNGLTPPTFIVHADDDKVVPVRNAILYHQSLEKYKIKNKFYRYDKGGHGFGMYNKQENGDWLEEMLYWINEK